MDVQAQGRVLALSARGLVRLGAKGLLMEDHWVGIATCFHLENNDIPLTVEVCTIFTAELWAVAFSSPSCVP
jgi:hypothetical protein